LLFLKACGFRRLANFFSLREKVAKRGKKRAVLSLGQFCYMLKLLAPFRVRILRGTSKNHERREARFRKIKAKRRSVLPFAL